MISAFPLVSVFSNPKKGTMKADRPISVRDFDTSRAPPSNWWTSPTGMASSDCKPGEPGDALIYGTCLIDFRRKIATGLNLQLRLNLFWGAVGVPLKLGSAGSLLTNSNRVLGSFDSEESIHKCM